MHKKSIRRTTEKTEISFNEPDKNFDDNQLYRQICETLKLRNIWGKHFEKCPAEKKYKKIYCSTGINYSHCGWKITYLCKIGNIIYN